MISRKFEDCADSEFEKSGSKAKKSYSSKEVTNTDTMLDFQESNDKHTKSMYSSPLTRFDSSDSVDLAAKSKTDSITLGSSNCTQIIRTRKQIRTLVDDVESISSDGDILKLDKARISKPLKSRDSLKAKYSAKDKVWQSINSAPSDRIVEDSDEESWLKDITNQASQFGAAETIVSSSQEILSGKEAITIDQVIVSPVSGSKKPLNSPNLPEENLSLADVSKEPDSFSSRIKEWKKDQTKTNLKQGLNDNEEEFGSEVKKWKKRLNSSPKRMSLSRVEKIPLVYKPAKKFDKGEKKIFSHRSNMVLINQNSQKEKLRSKDENSQIVTNPIEFKKNFELSPLYLQKESSDSKDYQAIDEKIQDNKETKEELGESQGSFHTARIQNSPSHENTLSPSTLLTHEQALNHSSTNPIQCPNSPKLINQSIKNAGLPSEQVFIERQITDLNLEFETDDDTVTKEESEQILGIFASF